MIASSSTFAALFRHALIALGETAPETRRETTDRLAATGLYQTMVQLGAVIALVAVGCCLPGGRPSATDWQQAYRLLAVVGLLGVAIAVPLMLTAAATGRERRRMPADTRTG